MIIIIIIVVMAIIIVMSLFIFDLRPITVKNTDIYFLNELIYEAVVFNVVRGVGGAAEVRGQGGGSALVVGSPCDSDRGCAAGLRSV